MTSKVSKQTLATKPLIKMTSIEQLQNKYDSSCKSHKGKIMSGKKERATKRYFKEAAARARRKQGKRNYRHTHRREEQPDPRDELLEDIHFANFLGFKNAAYGVPYNNTHMDEPVNLNECDILIDYANLFNNISETAIPQNIMLVKDGYDSLDDISLGSEYADEWIQDMRQIEREPNTKWHFNWYYDPKDESLTGETAFKRLRDEDETDDKPNKRAKIVTEEEQETAIFESMVAYMRQQLELAQAMLEADELYPCDCHTR